MRKSILIAVLVFLGLGVALLSIGRMTQTIVLPTYAPPTILEEGQVVNEEDVEDGDTIWVTFKDGGRAEVRYIGPDTPETWIPECYSIEAMERNRDLVLGKTVWLERDVEEYDSRGRLLRYVYLDPERRSMVNLMLLAEGYAVPMTIPPAYKYRQLFKAAAQEAWEGGLGLWSDCRVDGILTTDDVEENFDQYEGRIVTVEYEVAKVGTYEGMVFLNSSEDIYHHFTAVIYSDDVVCDFPESGIDLSALERETIRVTGKLEWYEKGQHDKPEIIIEAPWQLELVTYE